MPALKRVLSAVLFALLLPVLSQAQSIGYANPEDVGFSRQGLNRIFGWLDAAAKTPMPKDANLSHLLDEQADYLGRGNDPR